MDITQFFDALIKLQKYGYTIFSIERCSLSNEYEVKFTYVDMWASLASFQYDVTFRKGATQPDYVRKTTVHSYGIDVEAGHRINSIDEAVDFIIVGTQELQEKEREAERQKVLAKLSRKERELLGV